MHRKIAVLTAAGALAAPAAAQAHVTLQPGTAAAGGFTVENVRVPNETDHADTTKVALRLPPGFASVSYQPRAGWSVKLKTEKLAKPIQTDDGPVTEEVRQITWTGDGRQGKIAPGQFLDFPLSVQIPDRPGTTLTFKALQTYSDGRVVRWIGPESADTPAPTVKVTAGDAAGGAAPTSAPAAPAQAADVSGKASKGLAIVALIVGGLGLLAGLGGIGAARRR